MTGREGGTVIVQSRRLWRVREFFAGLTVAVLCACGGGKSPTAPSAAYLWEIADGVPPGGAMRHILTIPRGGTMDLQLIWGNVGTDLNLYLTSSTCAANPVSECEILARSDQKGPPLRERILHSVTQGQQLAAWVTSDASFAVTYRLTQRIE